jgi:hypothetical protein
MRVRLAAVLICLLLALSLAGCVHADRAIALNSDGSGTYTFTIGLSSQLVDLGGGSLTDSMNQYGDQVKQDGGSYSRYVDGGYSYWKYVRPFTSVSQLDDFLNETPQGQAGGNLNNADEAHVAAQAGFFSTTYHATGHMSLQVPNADQTTRDILTDARESFAITMPNWVSEHHGGQQSGNTVIYTVHFDEAATIDVTGIGLNVPHIALVAGGVLLAIILIIVGVLLLLRRSRRAPPPDTGAGYAAPASASFPASYAGMPQGSDAPTLPATPSFPPQEPYSQTPIME